MGGLAAVGGPTWRSMRGNLSGVDGVTIRDAHDADVAAITAIQNAFIATEAIEWTDTPHTVGERAVWLAAQQADGLPVLVATAAADDGEVVGWASFGPFRDSQKWPGYRLTVEHTIHVHRDHWGAGVGRTLMLALIHRATAMGLHVMVAAVDGKNDASIRFHERLGFREVARMPEIGTKFGRWLDLVLLQLVLGDAPAPNILAMEGSGYPLDNDELEGDDEPIDLGDIDLPPGA